MSISNINAGSVLASSSYQTEAITQASRPVAGSAALAENSARAAPPVREGLAKESESKAFMRAVQQTMSQMGLTAPTSSSDSADGRGLRPPSESDPEQNATTTTDIASNPAAYSQAMHAFMHSVVLAANQVSPTGGGEEAGSSPDAQAAQRDARSVASGYTNLSSRIQSLAQSLSTTTSAATPETSNLNQAYQTLLEAAPASGPAVSSTNGQNLQAFVGNLVRNMQQTEFGSSGSIISVRA